MSTKNPDNSEKKSKTNSQLKSSIVHKPFATGTINIFNPYRNKSNKSNQSHNQLSEPKLFLNAELEQPDELESEFRSELEQKEFTYQEPSWVDNLLNPWSISAIAVIFLVNLISGAVIWRNYRLVNNTNTQAEEHLTTLGSANLAAGEFMPLNLSTLSMLDTAEDMIVDKNPVIEPISPALAPINNTVALSSINSPYYYILTEYTGDRSLALARQKVNQVSLVNLNQGVFIYLGAFKEQEQAKEFVSQLKQENFTAQIYPFD